VWPDCHATTANNRGIEDRWLIKYGTGTFAPVCESLGATMKTFTLAAQLLPLI
jgi:hypothetical protein